MSNDTTTAPDYIAADTHTGPWTGNQLNARQAVGTYTADQIAAAAPTGVIWESIGQIRDGGREHFARSRYVADAESNLHLYASDGHKVIVHPAGRALRIIVKR